MCVQVHVSTLNAEVQRYKERNTNNEQNVSKLTTEVSDLKQVHVYTSIHAHGTTTAGNISTQDFTSYIIHKINKPSFL